MFNVNYNFNKQEDELSALRTYITKFKKEGEKFNGVIADSTWFSVLSTCTGELIIDDIKVEFVDSVWLSTDFTSPVIPTWYPEIQDNDPSTIELYEMIAAGETIDYEGEGYDMVEEYYLTNK